jgi:hypothetical protein
MNKNFMKKNSGALFAVSALLLLPSCGFVDWVKEKFGGSSNSSSMSTAAAAAADGGPVVATMNGAPLITKGMLDTEKKKLLDSNPQLQAMIAMMDEKQLDRNLADGMVSREVIRKYVADHNVENSDKYKKDYETVLSQVRDALNTRYFMDALEVKVTENEVKSFYDQNKDMIPNLLVSKGGVESVAVAFKDKAQADDFAAKVRNTKNDLNRVAKEAGLASKVKDFKLVNDQSIGIEPELRDQIVQVKSTPSVNTFKAGNEYWVVAASKKENPQYRALDQVKDELRQMLEKDKTMKRFEEEIARLRNEYRIELNEGFFAGNVDNAQAVQAALEAQELAVETAANEPAQDAAQAPTQVA